MFAVHAGIAIENARLHDQVQRAGGRRGARADRARTSTTGSSRRSTPSACRSRMVPELIDDEAGRRRGRRARRPRHRRAQPRHRRHPLVHPAAAARRSAARRTRSRPSRALAEELGMHAVVDLEVDLDDGATTCCGRPAARPPVGPPVHRPRGARPTSPATPARPGRVSSPRPRRRRARAASSRTTAGASTRTPQPVRRPRHHQGLGNMRDRAVAHGRPLRDRSGEPSRGTRIIVRVPRPDPTARSSCRLTGAPQ